MLRFMTPFGALDMLLSVGSMAFRVSDTYERFSVNVKQPL